MHVVATFIGNAPDAPFAALFGKRWMAPKYSICIFVNRKTYL
jgi:hypothetical protein